MLACTHLGLKDPEKPPHLGPMLLQSPQGVSNALSIDMQCRASQDSRILISPCQSLHRMQRAHPLLKPVQLQPYHCHCCHPCSWPPHPHPHLRPHTLQKCPVRPHQRCCTPGCHCVPACHFTPTHQCMHACHSVPTHHHTPTHCHCCQACQ